MTYFEMTSFEIPVWLGTRGPTKWVSGVTADTTCGEVADRLVAALDLATADCAFVLAEQWRGVERPLGADTRLLRVWQAWGDEQQHVRLVLRRVRSRNKTETEAETEETRASTSSTSSASTRRRRRRRHSGSSQASSCSGRPGDTPHPKAALAGDKHIESMMRVILKQGRIICSELLRMERDEDAEDEDEGEDSASRRHTSEPALGPETTVAETEALVADLLRLHALNQELAAMETRVHLLSANLVQLQPSRAEPDCDGVERRVATMRALNASAGEDVDRQQKQLADLSESLSARRASARQLEYDVNVVEKEGRRLHKELEKVMSIRIPEMCDSDDDHGNVLHESQIIYGELKQLQQASASTASRGRTLITASPESSSSSGVSSGSEAPACEAIACETHCAARATSFAPIRKCADEAAESNSDTGLGSLHSSTAGSADELETLV